MEQNKRGGYRPGSGRKPSGEIKIPITIYVEQKQIYPFGDKDNLRKEISAFISLYGKGGIGTMQIQDLTKPTNEIKPYEQPQTNFGISVPPKPETPATGLKASQFDEFHDEIIATTTIPQLTAVMKRLKSAVLTPKDRQNLEAIAKEHSATNMYND